MIKGLDLSKNESLLDTVYKGITKYCSENKREVIPFLCEDKNIQLISDVVYSSLPFVVKLATNREEVKVAVINNLETVRNKAKSLV